jgi:HK97 family phage portal protein
VREPFAGAWQRNQEWRLDTVLAHHAVYACITLIANDIGKLRPKLMEQDANGIWTEVESPAFSPVLRKPNHFQNRIQFIEWWVMSKLLRGNAYVLKERDERGVVKRLYLLDPQKVTVLIASDGGIYYDLRQDDLTGVEGVAVPASEIIHDRMNCIFHPLVGVSPLYSAGPAASVGQKIQANSANFFASGSNPSGILSSPSAITPAKSKELSELWNSQFSGENAGRVAVLGDGMKFEAMRMTAVDSQMIEQAKHTAETVCAAFHVPPWKVHVGSQPAYTTPAIANQVYYSDCLQSHIEQFELCMDEGLGIGVGSPKEGKVLGVELDLDGLLRMDMASQLDALSKGVGSGVVAPNEARRKIDLKPVKGGATPYLQQQNYSLAALDERDKNAPPPNSPGDRRATPATAAPATPPPQPTPESSRRALVALFEKAIAPSHASLPRAA